MNAKLDVTRRAIAPIVVELADTVDLAFERVMLNFLRKAAEAGLDLEQVTVTVFDEVFSPADSDELFDGTLGSFLSLLMDEVHLRRRLGNAMLDILMPATVMGFDIYRLISELEERIQESPQEPITTKVLPVLKNRDPRNPRGPVSGIRNHAKTHVARHSAQR